MSVFIGILFAIAIGFVVKRIVEEKGMVGNTSGGGLGCLAFVIAIIVVCVVACGGN